MSTTTPSLFDLKKLHHARSARFGDPEPVDSTPAAQFTVADMNFFYGDFHALHDLNMRLPEMRVTGLIGPSGCGKSTFLRILNRMYETIPKTRVTGSVRFGQADLLEFSPTLLRRRVGMVFQKPSPFPKEHLRQHCVRFAGEQSLQKTRPEKQGGGMPEARGAVGRGEGQTQRVSVLAVGWTAATALHRARAGG